MVHFDKTVKLNIGDDIKDKNVEMEHWNLHADIDLDREDCFDEDQIGEPKTMMPDVEELPHMVNTPEALDEHMGAKVTLSHD